MRVLRRFLRSRYLSRRYISRACLFVSPGPWCTARSVGCIHQDRQSSFSSFRLGSPAPRRCRRVEEDPRAPIPSSFLQEEGILNRRPPNQLEHSLLAIITFLPILPSGRVHIHAISAIPQRLYPDAHPDHNASPRTRQGLLQALSQLRRHSLQDRFHRLPRAMAQQCLQAWRAYAAA